MQLVAQDLLDALDHARARLAHARDAQRDVRLLAVWQAREHARGHGRVEAGQDQRDRLVGLVAQQRCRALWRHPAQKLERRRLGARLKAPEQLVRAVGAERTLDHAAREVNAACHAHLAAARQLRQFVEDRFRGVRLDRAQAGHFHRQRLDLRLAQPLQHVGRALRSQSGHQHGSLADPRQVDRDRRSGAGRR